MAKASATYPRRNSASRPSARSGARADEFASPFRAPSAPYGSTRQGATGSSRSAGTYAYPTVGSVARQPYISEPVVEQPRFEAMGGGRAQSAPRSDAVAVAAVAAAAVIVLLAAICFARIFLIDRAVILESEAQELSAQVSEIRSDASALEVQDTIMSGSAYIQAAATELGLAEPASTEAVYLPQDVVATNEDGSLSLAESVRRAGNTTAAE